MGERDGGPAFPAGTFKEEAGHGVQRVVTYTGMSLRDWFAGQAFAAFCANPVTNDRYRDHPWPEVAEKLAESAYEAADAMLSARTTERTDT